jgi:hypothetical protein
MFLKKIIGNNDILHFFLITSALTNNVKFAGDVMGLFEIRGNINLSDAFI